MTKEEAEKYAKTYIEIVKVTKQQLSRELFIMNYPKGIAEAEMIWYYIDLLK